MQGLGLTQNSMPCKWAWVGAEGSWGSITPSTSLLHSNWLPAQQHGTKHGVGGFARAGLGAGYQASPSFLASPPPPGTASFTPRPLLNGAPEAQFGPPAQGSCSWAPEARVCCWSRWASRESRLRLYLFICLAGLKAIRRADLSPLANTSSCFSGTSCVQCHIPQAGGPGSKVGT